MAYPQNFPTVLPLIWWTIISWQWQQQTILLGVGVNKIWTMSLSNWPICLPFFSNYVVFVTYPIGDFQLWVGVLWFFWSAVNVGNVFPKDQLPRTSMHQFTDKLNTFWGILSRKHKKHSTYSTQRLYYSWFSHPVPCLSFITQKEVCHYFGLSASHLVFLCVNILSSPIWGISCTLVSES